MLDQASQGLSYGPYLPDLPDSIMSGAGMCMLITARAVSTSTSACTMVPAGRLFPVVGMPFVMTTVVMRFTRLILIVIGTMMVMVMIMVRSLPRG